MNLVRAWIVSSSSSRQSIPFRTTRAREYSIVQPNLTVGGRTLLRRIGHEVHGPIEEGHDPSIPDTNCSGHAGANTLMRVLIYGDGLSCALRLSNEWLESAFIGMFRDALEYPIGMQKIH